MKRAREEVVDTDQKTTTKNKKKGPKEDDTRGKEPVSMNKAKGKNKVVQKKGKKIALRKNSSNVGPDEPSSSIVKAMEQSSEEADKNDTNDADAPAEGENAKKKKKHETMKLKISPAKIIEVMQSLNEQQLAAVNDMGFGELIHFGISEIPGKMAYDLLKGFNDVECTIQLQSRSLEITPDDVYVTLGLPRGGMVIRRKLRQKKKPFFDEVARRVGKDSQHVLPEDLTTELLKHKSGGEWFRKMFVLIVDTILISPCADGYCRTQIDYLFEDISTVKDYNWCAYTLDALAVAQRSWKSGKNSPFTGPISFLVAFYVDRVFHKTLLVSRVFPTVFGWTSELLRQREKMELETGDIGRGSVLERGDPDKLPRPTTVVVFEGPEKQLENPVTKAMVAFADAGEEAVRGLQNLMRRMNEVGSLIQNLESFRIAATTACKMMGVIPEDNVDEKDTVASLNKALAEDKLDTPEIVDAVENMLKVTTEMRKLAEDGPTFDIGLSFGGKNVS